MAEDNKFTELKSTLIKARTAEATDASKVDNKRDKQGRAYATGRRKDAVARVWLKPGSGKITVNGRDQEVYFARPTLRLVINQPFGITDRAGQYDVVATVKGGGLSGQAGAVLHGIAQALSRFEPVLRTTVKREGQYDVIATVKGGGLSGQAGAVRHGISRALVNYEPTLRPVLKPGGFLTRDPRAVERKKYGRPKARRSFQFSKR